MLLLHFTVIWIELFFGVKKGECKAIGEYPRRGIFGKPFGEIRESPLNRRTSVSYSVPEGTSFTSHSGGNGNNGVTVIVSLDGHPVIGGRPPTINQGSGGIGGQHSPEEEQRPGGETGLEGQQGVDGQQGTEGDNAGDAPCPCTCSCPSDAFSLPQGPINSGGIGEVSIPESAIIATSFVDDGTEVATSATSAPFEIPSSPILQMPPADTDLNIPVSTTPPPFGVPTDAPVPSETSEFVSEPSSPVDSANPISATPISSMETLPSSPDPMTSSQVLPSTPTEGDITVTSAPALPLSGQGIDASSLELHSTLVFGLGG
ncbi:uncharacterized protein CIMG_02158 [Coccidioides immitis RS]|uniref:Uncharacterized protein n=1 Tax=Coccidioides immitis (strain RS) TaxID=246410 RepID=J3KKS6_COCIM|nr:uncharacterized protein CIMG_02158 [Coccidioides immitis RS]EAS36804.3 hypothetical protein CIMG_02158 [Coccidioides immitis RS]TPX25134.1 hypothetical protein DIZ76_010583 [Coccidioides immitis]